VKSATLMRRPSTDQGTFGRFEPDDGLLELVSLELPWRDVDGNGVGDQNRSCINAGVYRCTYRHSPTKAWCYHVEDVRGRTGILIHSANFAGDIERGWQSDLRGCIALGMGHGALTNNFGHSQRAILRSHEAMDKLVAWAQREPFMLHVIEPG
jgi:hypothetical protein